MSGPAAVGALVLLLGVASARGAAGVPPDGENREPEALSEADARRLFLGFITDPKNLIRSCLFLGGIQVDGITEKREFATARIRYRIQCSQEEITMPPLTRTLREDFIYRHSGMHWEILGRAVELPPSMKGEGKAVPPAGARKAVDPLDRDRKAIAGQVLSWAALGRRPPGIEDPFPGADLLPRGGPILVSSESLGGVSSLALPGREVLVLSPEALLQRSVLEGERVWVRFDLMEIGRGSARAEVSIVALLLPAPPPGGERTRTRSRIEADFSRQGKDWVLTKYRQRTGGKAR